MFFLCCLKRVILAPFYTVRSIRQNCLGFYIQSAQLCEHYCGAQLHTRTMECCRTATNLTVGLFWGGFTGNSSRFFPWRSIDKPSFFIPEFRIHNMLLLGRVLWNQRWRRVHTEQNIPRTNLRLLFTSLLVPLLAGNVNHMYFQQASPSIPSSCFLQVTSWIKRKTVMKFSCKIVELRIWVVDFYSAWGGGEMKEIRSSCTTLESMHLRWWLWGSGLHIPWRKIPPGLFFSYSFPVLPPFINCTGILSSTGGCCKKTPRTSGSETISFSGRNTFTLYPWYVKIEVTNRVTRFYGFLHI